MYIPAHFSVRDAQEVQKLIRDFPLGALVSYSESGLDANHIPFEVVGGEDEKFSLIAHVARANPLWQILQNQNSSVLVIFKGEDSYISPNWYPSKHATHKQVPTWNYRVVHVHGQAKVREDEKFLRGVIGRLTRTHEIATQQKGVQEHPVWKMADAEPNYLQQMLQMIVGIEIEVTRIECKFKLSQNRNAEDREGAARALEAIQHSDMAARIRQHGVFEN